MKFQLGLLGQCVALWGANIPSNAPYNEMREYDLTEVFLRRCGYEIALTLGMMQANGARLRPRPGAWR
jgi:hypothetical protein